jgi:hypothetical protein
MKRLTLALAIALFGATLGAGTAHAAEFERYALESAGSEISTTQAGGHPDFTTIFGVTSNNGNPYALTRNIEVRLPAGLFGNPQAFPTCTSLQLGTAPQESNCPPDSQVGVTEITLGGVLGGTFAEPLYNMPITGNLVARFGFYASIFPSAINVRLDPADERLVASIESAPAAAELISARTVFWGVPASEAHDFQRMTPAEAGNGQAPPRRPSKLPETPFMTNPTSCGKERQVDYTVESYALPGVQSTMSAPFPTITGCGLLGFSPAASAKPTTEQATTGSGLDYNLSLPYRGLEFGGLPYDSEVRRAEVALPAGMTINPSQAEGLGVCSEEEFNRERFDSGPNEGCPETAKIGTVTATTPTLDRPAEGSLYVAKPYANPFGSLIALYMVLKVPDRGVLVKLPGKVTPDPVTGQLTTVFDELPELPTGTFNFHFREGARAPLVTPPACGTYQTISHFTPWSGPGTDFVRESPFQITSGVDHGPCPAGGTPAFHPGLVAGSVNNAAGRYSPFDISLTRTDSEQEITHFSIKLPPGVTGKLAGIPFCSDASIAAAKARERQPHGGEEELSSPSCPQASEVGHLLVGAGVGGVLAYVPGKLYLAGPYNGSPLSIVAITAAKAGPFDLGTVVVREALRINPETAEVFIDATGSDPIPHIVNGIPVHLRDIRVYTDRPDFVLNPTSCNPTSTASTVLGSGTDFASEADDRPITVATRYQAADCASLPYKPAIQLKLKGGTKRGGNPALTAILRPRPGDANSKKVAVALPHSEFLDQAHIKTICTRVQFKAGAGNGAQCPAASIYGSAKAWTPLLSEPLEGPIFLRSSEHPLPDLVLALHGLVDFTAVGRIDSVNGGIRNTFEAIPDAPISKVEVSFPGGKKSLLENSTNICIGKHNATVEFGAQSGKATEAKVPLQPNCKGKARKHNKQKPAKKNRGR